MDSQGRKAKDPPYFWPYDFSRLLRAVGNLENLWKNVGAVNPRHPGWHNDLIQLLKKVFARSLGWYTRPLGEYNESVTRSLEEIAAALDHLTMNMVALDRLSINMVALEGRMAEAEKQNAALREALTRIREVGNPQSARPPANSSGYIDTGVAAQRTTYVIGLFGSGRHYINDLLLQNLGERAKYFRDTIRLHPGPTPMIYSGHATIRHQSRDQVSPEVMGRILEAVSARFADLIFIYRHPLDSLLTNWIWWRTFLRNRSSVFGITQVFGDNSGFCHELERNFSEFEAFAEGAPSFFGAEPSARFLSFAEFVEETELHLRAATLPLRLEDFTVDPKKEFSKIVATMSVDLDLSRLCLARPKSKSHRYLTVKDNVARFRHYIDELDTETRRRIERVGYTL